jgi:hypothetical protein
MACRMRRTVVCVEQVTGAATAAGPGFCGWRGQAGAGERCSTRLPPGYPDLEQASGRLALIGRLAALLARPPADLRLVGLLVVPAPERAAVRRGGSRPGRDADGPRGRRRYRCLAPPGQMLTVTPPVGEPGGDGRGGHEHAVTIWPSAIIREARPAAPPPIVPGMVRARRQLCYRNRAVVYPGLCCRPRMYQSRGCSGTRCRPVSSRTAQH